MQIYEIPIEITPEGKLELPEGLLERMNRSQNVRLIALLDEADSEEERVAWGRLTSEQFLAGYADTDAIYDTIK